MEKSRLRRYLEKIEHIEERLDDTSCDDIIPTVETSFESLSRAE